MIHVWRAIFCLPADREKVHQVEEEEKALKEENVRLHRRLLRETERREQLSRQLSESESSLEMDDERLVDSYMQRKEPGHLIPACVVKLEIICTYIIYLLFNCGLL